jgi:hypothetical protein
MKIEMGKQYTCNGEPVRILCTDRPRGYPVVSMDEKTGDIEYLNENGKNPPFNNCNLVEAWKPQAGEWCLFWNDEIYKSAILSVFDRVNEYSRFQCKNGNNWKYCSKFTGELPEHLKDL